MASLKVDLKESKGKKKRTGDFIDSPIYYSSLKFVWAVCTVEIDDRAMKGWK